MDSRKNEIKGIVTELLAASLYILLLITMAFLIMR